MDRPKPSRRWFQISLRTLMLLVTVASIGFGWLGYQFRQAQRQKEAVEAIRELGGLVGYVYEEDSKGRILHSPTPPGPAWLRKLLGDNFFANVAGVSMRGTSCTDADLVHVRRFTSLKFLDLLQTQITDAGLVHLQGLTKLEQLYFDDTLVTDEACQELKKTLPNVHIFR